MTWLKTGDEFPDDCAGAGLSDAAYRTHHEGLTWCMRRLTGGRITERDVRRFAETADPAAAIDELVAAGWWMTADDGWRIKKHMSDQATPAQVKKRRSDAAAASKRYRQNKGRKEPESS